MEFDADWADWILPAIFVTFVIARGLISRIARSMKNPGPTVAPVPREKAHSGFGEEQIYRAEENPGPIEPR